MTARRLGARVAAFILLAGSYLVLAGATSGDECIAAVLTAAVAVMLAEFLSRVSGRDFVLQDIGWPRLIGATLVTLLRDVVSVGAVLASRKPDNGSFERRRYTDPDGDPAGGNDQQAGAGRRAILTLATSLPPGSFVIDVMPAQRELLVHRLARRPASSGH